MRVRRGRGHVLLNTASDSCIRTCETGRETVPRDFVEDERIGRMSWENTYSEKLPALTSLRTLVVSRLLRRRQVR